MWKIHTFSFIIFLIIYIPIHNYNNSTYYETTNEIYGYVNTDSLNIRRYSNANAEILKTVPYNTRIKLLDTTNTWFYVEYNGIKGWVCELNGAIGTKVENLMTARELEIFEESKYSENASIIGLIPVSTKIKEAYHLDEWSGKTLVTYNGITGYCGYKYLK